MVPPDYPLREPSVTVTHSRFSRLPHVVWAKWICLYLADDDWDRGTACTASSTGCQAGVASYGLLRRPGCA